MFNPPKGVTNGAEYRYGNFVYVFDGIGDVWNIKDGTILGQAGPAGAQGSTGPTGPTGGGASGDGAAILYYPVSGSLSVRRATDSLTGVASFDPVFFTTGTTGHVRLVAAYSVTGIQAVPQASEHITGAASFNPIRFVVSATGNVDLEIPYTVTGDTVQAGSGISIGAGRTINNTGVLAINGIAGGIGITGVRHGIPYFSPSMTGSGLSASSVLLFDGTSLTFGAIAANTPRFTITGPSLVLGSATQVTGGVFRNPTEAAPLFTLGAGTNDLIVNGASGSIQRFVVEPNARMTIKAGTSWHPFTSATETIAVIVENRSNPSMTAAFESNILVNSDRGAPSLFGVNTSSTKGVTGGVSVFTIMRVNKGNGGLTMGFVISTGMSAAGSNIQ